MKYLVSILMVISSLFADNELVPIYRYYSQKDRDHYYAKKTDVAKKWTREGIEFYAFPDQVEGTVPINRYYSKKDKDHFYAKKTDVASKWTRQGVEFYAFPDPVEGTIPIHRFYDKKNKDHFYTKDPNPKGNWTPQGIEFYAYEGPGPGQPSVVSQTKPELEAVCLEVIAKNPKPVKVAIRGAGGTEAAIKVLTIQVMKATRGKANPKMVDDLLRQLLASRREQMKVKSLGGPPCGHDSTEVLYPQETEFTEFTKKNFYADFDGGGIKDETTIRLVGTKKVAIRTVSYWKNGNKSKESFLKDGKTNGESTMWSPDGKDSSVVVYKSGKICEGIVKTWGEDNTQNSLTTYENGKHNGLYVLGSMENPSQKGFLKDGKRNGLWTEWNNGVKRLEATYVDGKTGRGYGNKTEWNKDGQKTMEESKLRSEWWYDNGKQKQVSNYNNDGQEDGVSFRRWPRGEYNKYWENIHKDGILLRITKYFPNETKSEEQIYIEKNEVEDENLKKLLEDVEGYVRVQLYTKWQISQNGYKEEQGAMVKKGRKSKRYNRIGQWTYYNKDGTVRNILFYDKYGSKINE